MRRYVWVLILLSACGTARRPQEPQILRRTDYLEIDHKMQPFIAQARKTLPLIKQRYLAGLPEGEELFLTIKLRDPDDAFEQAMVKIVDWKTDQVLGKLASPLFVVQSYHQGDLLNFKEDAIIDWMLRKPDGSREGDYVGRFLRTYGQGS